VLGNVVNQFRKAVLAGPFLGRWLKWSSVLGQHAAVGADTRYGRSWPFLEALTAWWECLVFADFHPSQSSGNGDLWPVPVIAIRSNNQ
jgi:hypothetical protein